MKEKIVSGEFVPEKFVFKNQKFRKLCVGAMLVSLGIMALYFFFCFINFDNCMNLSRLYWRMLLTLPFAIETALFAHRNSVYMEIGGDFALARRSCAIMIINIIICSIVESYYVSAVAAPGGGTLRIVFMIAIIVVGCASLLPLVEFEFRNMNFWAMRTTVLIGILASLVSFFIGFFFIGINEMEYYRVESFKEIVSRVLDSFTPVYLINCANGVVVLVISHIELMKEQRKMSKFFPKDLSVDSFASPEDEEEEEDEEDDEDDEYIGL